MIYRDLILSLLLTTLVYQVSAQEIENNAPFKYIDAVGYIRLTVDNDYFTGTDEQYTEGVNLEICMPWVKKFPLTKLLVCPHFADIRYGIGIEQAGYTPYYLQNEWLPINDRPFSGTFPA